MPKSKSWQVSRRHVLRGIGATIGLPMLEAMMPVTRGFAAGAAGESGQPVRFAAFFMPNGVNHAQWDLQSHGALEQLSPILMPLDPVKSYVNVFSGLRNSSGGHNQGTSSFLTGRAPKKTPKAADVDVGNASIDQIIGANCPGAILPTLELGMSPPRRGTASNDVTHVYTSHISWKNAHTPVAHELNPKRAFDRLFRGFRTTRTSALGSAATPEPSKSVLDLVHEDAKKLMKKVGRADQQKLDQYLTAVREVEDRMINQKQANVERVITPEMAKQIRSTNSDLRKAVGRSSRKDDISAVPQIPYREYGKLMMDVMALALWSNSTRSTTLMFGDGSHGRNMSFLEGVSGNHHSISHHGQKSDMLDQYARINTFFIEQYAYFVKKLASMEEGGSNVLENSMVLFGSNMGDGQRHSSGNIPIVVSGRGGGRIKTGRHISGRGSTGDLHRSALDVMNLKSSQIGGGGGTVGGFRA